MPRGMARWSRRTSRISSPSAPPRMPSSVLSGFALRHRFSSSRVPLQFRMTDECIMHRLRTPASSRLRLPGRPRIRSCLGPSSFRTTTGPVTANKSSSRELYAAVLPGKLAPPVPDGLSFWKDLPLDKRVNLDYCTCLRCWGSTQVYARTC